jgi:hypothetical protein
MAQQNIILEEYDPQGIEALSQTGRPIPGQSLTSNPDESYPWEGAPEFVNFKEALDFATVEMLKEENFLPLMKSISDGVPIIDIVLQMGYVGFRSGKWNPDLMLILIEPLVYVLMSLAEKSGIQYRLDDEDDLEDDEEDMFEEKARNIAETIKEKTKGDRVPKSVIPSDILQKIEEVEIPKESLLSRPEEQQMDVQSESLLSRG